MERRGSDGEHGVRSPSEAGGRGGTGRCSGRSPFAVVEWAFAVVTAHRDRGGRPGFRGCGGGGGDQAGRDPGAWSAAVGRWGAEVGVPFAGGRGGGGWCPTAGPQGGRAGGQA